MYMIVIGAEPEGRRFISLASEQNHEIVLIEPDEEKARQVLKEHSIRVLQGKANDDQIFEEAGIDKADAVVAITYDDAMNLMAMVIAKENAIATRISLVNYQSHAQLFETLGAQTLSDPARIIADQLYQKLPEK